MLEELVKSMPPVTRAMCLFKVLLSLLVYLDFVQPYSLFFNTKLIFMHWQVWRLVTNIFFIGDLTLFTLFRIFFFYRQSSKLEESTFRGNSANFCYFLLYGIVASNIMAYFLGLFNLSDSFQTMVLYVWCRLNKNARFHLFGIFPVQAPYLVWVFMGISLYLNESVLADLVGIGVAHVYYFLTDVYPRLPLSSGVNILSTPVFFMEICRFIGIIEKKQIDEDRQRIQREAERGHEEGMFEAQIDNDDFGEEELF